MRLLLVAFEVYLLLAGCGPITNAAGENLG
jgi:uncharacterized protein YceK